ncbi:hypothetical protein TSUD_356310 [Trifolium subterraneum]|uniref:F-box domain-containing protein n=1 Tax=Trifolium subterraneum TaxID=3900 RepID=A0A2Z6M5Q6_TRISU|nr:hypothetical protein TSUD_356310 [Trifolium subterraneum]
MEQEEDRLSNLPKIILHNILSRLPEKDAARTSVLSKAWLEIWYTFPNLSICDSKFIGKSTQPVEDLQKKRTDFIDYVKSRLARFSKQRLAIKEFKLSVNCFELGYMSRDDVDLWLKLASESGVEVLELCNDPYKNEERQSECYVLPKSVIEAESLINQLEVLVEVTIYYFDVRYVKEVLQNIKPQNVLTSLTLTLDIFKPIIVDAPNPMFLDISTPPPSIKHLDLCIHPMSENLFPYLVDFLLLCCVPATISLSLNTSTRAFIEFFYEKLTGRKDDDCFCRSSDTKCWWHNLKDVKVTNSMKTDETVDLKTMLPEEDAARTSVLPKAWLEIWYTFPNLCFLDFQFIGKSTQPVEDIVDTKVVEMFSQPMDNSPKTRKDFIDYVNSRLARFWKQGLAIKEFNLYVNCFELGYMSRDVDLWLKLASESGIEVLDLCNIYANLKEANIDAPNLLLCGFQYGHSKPIISFSRISSELVVLVEINIRYFDVCYIT